MFKYNPLIGSGGEISSVWACASKNCNFLQEKMASRPRWSDGDCISSWSPRHVCTGPYLVMSDGVGGTRAVGLLCKQHISKSSIAMKFQRGGMLINRATAKISQNVPRKKVEFQTAGFWRQCGQKSETYFLNPPLYGNTAMFR